MGGRCACTSRRSLRGRDETSRTGARSRRWEVSETKRARERSRRSFRVFRVGRHDDATKRGRQPEGRVGLWRHHPPMRVSVETNGGGSRDARREGHAPRDMVLRLEVEGTRGETMQEERACAPLLCRQRRDRCANFSNGCVRIGGSAQRNSRRPLVRRISSRPAGASFRFDARTSAPAPRVPTP